MKEQAGLQTRRLDSIRRNNQTSQRLMLYGNAQIKLQLLRRWRFPQVQTEERVIEDAPEQMILWKYGK